MSTQPNLLSTLMPALTADHAGAVQALASAGLTLPQMAAALVVQSNLNLHAAETAKTQPLNASFTIADTDFQALMAHMQDGGGVGDDNAPLTANGQGLGQMLWQAIMDKSQAEFWPLLIEMVKSWAIIRGRVQPVNGGGVIFNGVGPSGGPVLPAVPATPVADGGAATKP